MARVTIAHRPELTSEGAEELFESHFAGRYDVYRPNGIDKFWNGRPDFIVKGPRRAAVAVCLRQSTGATHFVFTWVMPPLFLMGLLLVVFLGLILLPLVLIVWIMVRRGGKPLEAEIRSFIESAGEFK